MALIKYREANFNLARKKMIVAINDILTQYNGKVSVRQIYYRLVAADAIPNKQTEYDKVQSLVTDARYAGLIDWDAVEDRGREPVRAEEWKDGRSALEDITTRFRMDRWKTQPYYVELWVEKAALAGVLWPIAADYHVTLMVNKGYSSASAMKDGADRIKWRAREGKRVVILYVGDHDPSGLDMLRDVPERLLEFGCPSDIDVRGIALTWAQIKQFKPPPNYVKRKDDPKLYKDVDGSLADSRAQSYVEQFGEESYEVDALPPKDLDLITRTALNAYIDKDAMKKAITRENLIKAQIKKFTAGYTEPK